MKGRILSLAYGLHIQRLGDWALDRWALWLPLAASVLLLAQWLVRGMPVLPFWHWLVILALVIVAAAVWQLCRWAASQHYIVFVPDVLAEAPGGMALDPEDKVRLYATGRFAVQGKSCVFAGLMAYWRTFATREHAIMAIAHASRCLPEAQVGMWYIFFKARDVRTITPGRLSLGSQTSLALRVVYCSDSGDPGRSGRQRRRQPVTETVYLAFDDALARQRVWADLGHDPR